MASGALPGPRSPDHAARSQRPSTPPRANPSSPRRRCAAAAPLPLLALPSDPLSLPLLLLLLSSEPELEREEWGEEEE